MKKLPIEQNPVVDKMGTLDVADDDDKWVPKDRTELNVALHKIASSIDDSEIPNMYASLKNAVKKAREDKGDEHMTKNVNNEVRLRAFIRTILREAFGDETNPVAPSPEATVTPKALKDRKPRSRVNKEGEDFQRIAQELGLSVSGSKRFVDHMMAKLNWLATKFEGDDLDGLVLQIANKYIEDLADTGELDDEEVQFLRDNVDQLVDSPDMSPEFLEYFNYEIKQLPGFKEHLWKYLGKDPKTGRNIR